MKQSPNTLSAGKEIPDFVWKPESLSLRSQVIVPCPVPNESSPHRHPVFFKLHINISS
jgi:hypothetical protein